MQEVGRILREERLRQGKSINDMAEQIHFTPGQIEAIEEGNLDYFKDDLTYMKFRVQYYCKALNVDFSQFKDSFEEDMNTYTTMLSANDIEYMKKENERLNQKIKQSSKTASNRKKKKKLRLRVDVSVVSMLVIGIVMVAILSFAFGRYIFPNMVNENNQSSEEALVTSIPSISEITSGSESKEDESKVIDEEEEQKEEACTISLKEVDATNYEIVYSKNCTAIDVSVNFKNKSWVGAYIDGTKSLEHTFGKGESTTFNLTPGTNSKLLINMGYCKGQEFVINEQTVTLNSSVSNYAGAYKITFTLKGE